VQENCINLERNDGQFIDKEIFRLAWVCPLFVDDNYARVVGEDRVRLRTAASEPS